MKKTMSLLSKWLVQHNAIQPGDRELYEYAAYSFLLSVTPVVVFLIATGVLGLMREGIMIVFPFMCIRKFCGGYHAGHAYICLPVSFLLLAACLYASLTLESGWVLHALVALAGGSIILHSPIDSENRRLAEDEIKEYKKITIVLVTVTVIVYVILNFLKIEKYSVCLGISLILTASLQLPCIVKRRILH